MSSHVRSFRFRDTAICVTSSDAAALTWLQEFLCPWFASGSHSDGLRVDYRIDDAAFARLERACGSNPGTARPCFALDSSIVSFPSWERDGRLLLLDAKAPCYLVVGPGGIEIVARQSGRSRLTLMRTIRELVAIDQRDRGGIELHAAALASDGSALLFAGPKRAGKTTLLCWGLHDATMQFLANDRSFAFVGTAGVEAAGVPTIVTLRAETVARFPRLLRTLPDVAGCQYLTLAEMDAAARTLGSCDVPVDIRLSPAQFARQLGVAATGTARVAAIVFPEVVGDEASRLEKLTTAAAAQHLDAALYGRTLGASRATALRACVPPSSRGPERMPRLSTLLSAVPCYRLRHGSDVYALPVREGILGPLIGS